MHCKPYLSPEILQIYCLGTNNKKYCFANRNCIGEVMCGPFKSHGGILRLLEMIFSGVALILVLFRGGLANPWGVWCHFVWFFCFLIPLLITVAEALKLQVLMAMFLPDWSDLTCGLTMICTLMMASSTPPATPATTVCSASCV